MSSVFLSYDREDGEIAGPIARVLEKAGHSVWWDRHIKAGSQYNKEIDSALADAEAVVVLWSERSVNSPWVRDEAAAGRDSGRLVPVKIDATEPPLGFRQYQTIELLRWRGRGKPPALGELLDAVGSMRSKGPPAPATQVIDGTRSRPEVRWLLIAAVIAASAIAWFMLRPGAMESTPTVLVVSADDNPASKRLTRDLLINLGRLQLAEAGTIQLMQEGSSRKADFTFQVSGLTESSKTQATIALVGRTATVLWSKDFERPTDRLGDLRQQIGLSAARVLNCANEALSSDHKVDQQTLRLYLGGCATYADLIGTSVGDVGTVIPIFAQVTERVPEFKGAWAKLLLAEAEVATNSQLSDRASIENALRRHIAAARRLDPRMPEVLQAEILLQPLTDVSKRMRLIEAAVKLHPDNPGLLSFRSNLLMAVGRMNAAVQDAKRAAQIDTLSPAVRAAYIFVLAHSGQIDLAQNELANAQAVWPGAASLNEVGFSIALRYGNPMTALDEMRSGRYRSDIPASQQSLLRARLDPSPENVARAVATASSIQDQTVRPMIQVLTEFGHEQEAIDRLLKYEVTREQFTDVMFRPNTRKMREDPRFMLVAKRFGLLDYWLGSGHWPDFCSDPTLPYDCKAEAAKLK